MKNIVQKQSIDLRCYIIQNNKTIEFKDQKERSQYLKERMHVSNGIISSYKTPYELGITEFGNIINGAYIKQNIKIIEPPKIYFVTMERRRYYGSTLKQLADKIGVNYILLIQWFNGKAAIDIKFNITKIGYIQGRKTTFISFDTSGTQYYMIIDGKTFIYNNLADMSKKLKMSPNYISKLLCGVRFTDKCSEIGYHIDGDFIKSEKSIPSEYEKYSQNNPERIREKNKKGYTCIMIKDNTRMLDEIRLKDISGFLNIPLFKEDRDLLAAKINIKNRKGIPIKWTKIKKLLIESGSYELESRCKTINKQPKDYVIIRIAQ